MRERALALIQNGSNQLNKLQISMPICAENKTNAPFSKIHKF